MKQWILALALTCAPLWTSAADAVDATIQPKLVMYATDWCPYCAEARAWFAEEGIAYTEYDIEKDDVAGARHATLLDSLGDEVPEGITGVPLFAINDGLILGFDREALERELSVVGDNASD